MPNPITPQPPAFNTIVQLLGFYNSSVTGIPAVVFTEGYAVPGDMALTSWRWDQNGGSDNGGTVRVDAGGHTWRAMSGPGGSWDIGLWNIMPGNSATVNDIGFANWLTYINSVGGNFNFRDALYQYTAGLNITATIPWQIFGFGATLQIANGTAVTSGHDNFYLQGAANGYIWNLITDGNRAGRPSASQNAHNWRIESCTDVTFDFVRNINAVVDGAYIHASDDTNAALFSKRVRFVNGCRANNPWRNGWTFVTSLDCLLDQFSADTGAQSGVDVEPNAGAAAPCNFGLRISNGTMLGNAGPAINTFNTSIAGGGDGITISNIICDGTGTTALGMGATFDDGVVFNNIQIRNYNNNALGAMTFQGSANIRIQGDNLSFSNCHPTTDPCVYVSSAGASGVITGVFFNNCGTANADSLFDMSSAVGLNLIGFTALNCGDATANTTLVKLGAECSIVESFFSTCTGTHVTAGTNSTIKNLKAINAVLNPASASQQEIIYIPVSVPGVYIDDITATVNSGASGSLRAGILCCTDAGHIGATNFGVGTANFTLANQITYNGCNVPQMTTAAGTFVMTPIVTYLALTGGTTCAVTLPPSTGFSGGSAPVLYVANNNSGTATVAAAAGDTLATGASLTTGLGGAYTLDAVNKVWSLAAP